LTKKRAPTDPLIPLMARSTMTQNIRHYLALSKKSSDNRFLSHLHTVAHLNEETMGRGKVDTSLVEHAKKSQEHSVG
jgi:hypothetical protein